MQAGTFWRTTLILLSLFVSLGTLNAQTQNIRVTRDGLDPATVHVVTGEWLHWLDADGGGPYSIYGVYPDGYRGFWTTTYPGPEFFQISFDQPGTHYYYDQFSHLGTIIVEQAPNTPPAVRIDSPTNNAVFRAPASFSFTAFAADLGPDGLSNVQFYLGANRVDYISTVSMATALVSTSVTNLAAGNYTLTAIAYDMLGASNTLSISITVMPRPTLVAQRSGNQLVVSWDTNNAAGLALQTATNLIPNPTWTAVTTPPVLVGTQMMVTNPITGKMQFFTLTNQ